MKIIYLLIINLSFVSVLFAEVAKIPCIHKDGTLGLNSLNSFDCKLASKITLDTTIRKEYKIHVDKKLSQIVARKASEVIEDLTLLDSYFDQNNIDLGKEDIVKQDCQLKKIAQPVCTNGAKPEQISRKLSMILEGDKYLPNDRKIKTSLYTRMYAKAGQVRSGQKINEKTCPVNGHSGLFILDSHLTNADAKNIVESIKKGNSKLFLDEIFKSYPQLKMLTKGKDDSLRKVFEKEMLNIKENDIPKDFVNKFFKNVEVQKAMAESVSLKCKELSASINRFACEDNFTQLALNEDDRDYLFDDDKEDRVFKEVSRGLSCEIEDKSTGEESEPLFSGEGSIHDKLSFLKKDIRQHKDTSEVDAKLESFCNKYLCNEQNSMTLFPSCKNGGPVSSKDLLLSCPTKGNILTCDGKMQKYYEFVSSMERDAKISGVQINGVASDSHSSDSRGDVTDKPRGYSTFYQNFLGIEGTLAAEGKIITPVTIAEKKAEFTERKLEVTSSQNGSLTRGKEAVAVEVRPEPIAREMEISQSDEHSASVRQADEYRRAFQSQNFTKPNYEINKDANGKTKKVKFTDTDSSTIDEMKKLRTELADALGKVKGSDDEQLAAIADNNASIVAPKALAKSTAKNLSSGEKERLDAYRDSLNNWENKLRDWQENISDRQVSANNGGGVAGADGRSDIVAPNGDQANNRGSAGGAKLTKSAVAGPAGVNGKGDGSAERAPGTEKSDLEAGIVNSEKLATLEKESLKKLGIVVTDSFIIKVRHKDKIYSVPVKTYNHGGKEMYVPLLNDKDRELSKIVYESPLFKDYRDYQIQRQYKLDQELP